MRDASTKKCFHGAVELAACVLARFSPSAAEPQTPSLRLAAARVQPHRRPQRRRRRRPRRPQPPPFPAASRGRASAVVARHRSKIGPVPPAPRPRPRSLCLLRHFRGGQPFLACLAGRRGRFARRLTHEALARVARGRLLLRLGTLRRRRAWKRAEMESACGGGSRGVGVGR